VLWAHAWTAHGNPRFYAGRIDLANFMVIGVNGVELFFVISGFCMYYFYASKPGFSYHDFFRFLVKRWFRLSPAFYAATVIYVLTEKYLYHRDINFLLNFLHSLFYLDHVLPDHSTAAHFWTLTVEWQFYFIIGVLLISQNKIGFKTAFGIIFGTILLAAIVSVIILQINSDRLAGTIIFRGVEFGCGVLAAHSLISEKKWFKRRALFFFIFVLIVYAGHGFTSNIALEFSPLYFDLFKLLGFALMGIGFAGILYLSVTSRLLLNRILGNPVFKKMGRISYSFYLLHALVYLPVADFTKSHLHFLHGISAPVFTTLVSVVLLYPLSVVSFQFLEKPFFNIGNLTTK
jgi:peptidoglycan/LPS O-acetylase OafA/YrhL